MGKAADFTVLSVGDGRFSRRLEALSRQTPEAVTVGRKASCLGETAFPLQCYCELLVDHPDATWLQL